MNPPSSDPSGAVTPQSGAGVQDGAGAQEGGTGRSPLVGLLATGAALAVIAGLASFAGDSDAAPVAGETERAPLERTSLVCPPPPSALAGDTWYTGVTPDDGSPAGDSQPGTAGLLPLPEWVPGDGSPDEEPDEAEGDDEDDADAEDEEEQDGEEADDPAAQDGGGGPGPSDSAAADPDDLTTALEEPGLPVTDVADDEDAPALGGTAEHRLAPGWTVQQTSLVRAASGVGRGLLGTACQRPDTAFWFAGASTAEERHDYVHLMNPDASATVVDIAVHGAEGALDPVVDEGVTVPGGSAVPVRLDTLVNGEEDGLAVRVSARTGRIGAQIQVADEERGADWLPPVTSGEDGAVVLPGIPADAQSAELTAFTPGDSDVGLSIEFVGPTSTITPLGNERITLRAGMVESVDLEALGQGEPGALLLTPEDEAADDGPVLAALRVTTGEDDTQEMAFLPGSAPVEHRATASGNDPGAAELLLSAPGDDVEVEITATPGAGDGDASGATTETHTVPGGTTLAVEPEIDEATEGRYALTVTRAGGGELYAARVLSVERDDIPMVTVQALPDDASTVPVPETGEDLSVVTRN